MSNRIDEGASSPGLWGVVLVPSCAIRRCGMCRGEVDVFRAFASVHEFDRWRNGLNASPALAEDVSLALRELGSERESFPSRLRVVLVALSLSPSVPPLRSLYPHDMARRTFYRLWSSSIAETPARFLMRVRTLHAIRLIAAEGVAPKRAAHIAGFSSVNHLYTILRKRSLEVARRC